MKINEIDVSGFGVWRGVRLTNLAAGLNVFYGANESGKTTLMQFVRGVLYGYSPPRRGRYLPPVHGGLPGGSLSVTGPHGTRTVERLDLEPEEYPLGRLRLIAEEGVVTDEGALAELLAGLDETTYVNVFAVGLHELEELRSLSDTDAADMLYKLSAGLDRVSLIDVVRELDVSRNRLFGADGRASRITQLLAERDRLQAEIEDLRTGAERYAELAGDQHDFDDAERRLSEEVREREHEAAVLEAAVNLRDTWARRRQLARRLRDLGEVPQISPQALEELDRLNERIKRRRERAKKARERSRRARRLAAAIQVNATLERLGARIAAASEQLGWMESLEKQIRGLSEEIARLEKQAPPPAPVAPPPPQPKAVAAPSLGGTYRGTPQQALDKLKPLAIQLKKTKRALQDAHEEHKAAEEAAKRLPIARIAEPTVTKPAPAAIEAAGDLVARLRKRMQIDEKLERLARQEDEIADEGRRHLEHRVLSNQAMFALGVPVVGGAATTFASVFFRNTFFGSNWPLATLLGGTAVLGSIVFKSFSERNAAVRYEEAREQLEALESQINKVKAERDQLDAELPRGGGPIAVRLRTAQQELAALQGAATAVEERQTVRQEAVVSRERLDEAIAAYRRARKQWRSKVQELGLPANIQMRTIAEAARVRVEPAPVVVVATPAPVVDHRPQLEAKRAELAQRRREVEALQERWQLLIAETGLQLGSERPGEQLRLLRAELTRQDELRARKQTLLTRRRRYAQRFARERRRLRRALRSRHRILRRAGAYREDELRRLVATHSEALRLRGEADAVEREVLAAIGGVGTLDELGQLLDAVPEIDLEARWDAATAKAQAAERQLKDLYERRGRRGEQIANLLADRRLPDRVFELGVVEEQLRQAIERWQTVSLAAQTLEHVRRVFERDHQPIVLREASEHLARLTRGRYTRIWAPLDRAILLIDNGAGETIDVEKLSRGTREQIFLSLRLALVAAYARRGVQLPMVLDDVLVNFDQDRATAAAAVLRDFAAAGHQLLVFTCHEHVFKIFKALKVPCQELPGNVAQVVELPPEESPKPRRTPRPRAPRKAAPSPAPPPPPALPPVIEEIVESPAPLVEPEPLPLPPALPVVEVQEIVEPTPEPVFVDVSPLLEVVEAYIEPAANVESVMETVLPVIEALPPPVEIHLPPTPPPRPRRRRFVSADDAHRFTWEDPVDLKPSETYLLGEDDDEA